MFKGIKNSENIQDLKEKEEDLNMVETSYENSLDFEEDESLDFEEDNSLDFEEDNSLDFEEDDSLDFEEDDSLDFEEDDSLDFEEDDSLDFEEDNNFQNDDMFSGENSISEVENSTSKVENSTQTVEEDTQKVEISTQEVEVDECKVENNTVIVEQNSMVNEDENCDTNVDISMIMEQLQKGQEGVSRTYAEVLPEQIVITQLKKSCRVETLIGLTESIKVWGVCSPLHVLKLETEDRYVLLSGLRRLYASMRVDKTKPLPCIVWHFENIKSGKYMQNVIGLMLNKSASYTPKELWECIKYLEENNNLKPSELEYLLNMHAGDAMKLKDLMLSEGYEEIIDKMLLQEIPISTAYDKVCKLRKKEEKEKLQKEDNKAISSDTETIDTNDTMGVDSKGMTDVEVREDLGMEQETDNEDINNEDDIPVDLGAEVAGQPEKQEVGNRHIIDPIIKQRTLRRDNFACQCCGINGEAFIGVLVYHHKVPVYCGGEDSVDNGITLCTACHNTLHLYEQGKLPNLKDLLKDYDEMTQGRIKKIVEIGNIAIKAAKAKKFTNAKIKAMAAEGTKHIKPDAVLQDNLKALREAQNEEKEEINVETETESVVEDTIMDEDWENIAQETLRSEMDSIMGLDDEEDDEEYEDYEDYEE